MKKIRRFVRHRRTIVLRGFLSVALIAAALVLLSQTALAKNTYVITDGSRVFTYSTYATDPAQILGEAGLTLDENDTYTAEMSISGSSITVRRAKSVTISYYGETMHVSAFDETVGELLDRMNISLGENDVLSVSTDADTYDDMVLTIDQVMELSQTYSGSISHDTQYCYDSSIPEGTQVVLTRGVDGQTLCTADVKYVNGTEVSRTILSEVVTTAPTTEVIAVGTASADEIDPNAMPVIEDGKITLPTGEVLTYTHTMQCGATAYYCEPWEKGITYSGTKARVGEIAVDPDVIPLGTRLYIVTNDGEYVYGTAVAEDTGYLIDGTRIDLYFNTRKECIDFGYRKCTVYFLG